MVFITKNVAIAALLIAPVIAAPLSQTPEELERRGVDRSRNHFESREWDGELEERGVKTNIAVGAVGGYLIGKLWQKFRHRNDNKDAPKDAPVEARDLVDFIYAREVLNRARALERRNSLENMINELD
ncbi:hypothetical protein DFP72DRAFT_854380 [Ephemerocybe angulata]|uniref:Uncharacterized protein n=1 Tax=Ephemerocybe angulata TaxID=980116 RepID=A0A8H6HI31_9AGAR|nr:hypothetical protein DFP72DRAFT_854380 [Tulosesus angulatus]